VFGQNGASSDTGRHARWTAQRRDLGGENGMIYRKVAVLMVHSGDFRRSNSLWISLNAGLRQFNGSVLA